MALQIGRVGIDVALDNPEVWDYDGEIVTVTGELFAATIYDAKVLRQQLLGHVNNRDEPIVPVIWSEDTLADGFYRVLDAQVGSVPGSYSAFWFPFSVTLHRVSDYAVPLIESILVAPTVRTNDHGTDEGRHYIGYPATAIARLTGLPVTVASEDGNMTVQYSDPDDAPGGLQAVGRLEYTLTPADWYDGAARVELDYANDGTFRRVVGRQIPNLPGEHRWRISNGIIRITLEDTAEFLLGISRWTGSAWTTPTEFFVGTSTGATRNEFPDPDTITILRNSINEVVVRFTLVDTATGYTTVDISLHRGMPWCETRIGLPGGPSGSSFTFAAGRSVTDSGVVFADVTDPAGVQVSGLKNNAADGNGYFWMVATPWTVDSSQTAAGFIGTLIDPVLDPPSFMLGLSLNTGAATAPSTPEGAVLNYFAAMSETIRVVER